MITRNETHVDKLDVWARLAALLPADVIAWRQDGKAMLRDGKYVARFVCYIEAGTVRERLDSVLPGEWDLTLELLPQQQDEDGAPMVGFKARIQCLGVIREDVGQGKDYKSAATDAFKRAAVRFGIGHELYQMEQVWVQVDGDGKYAKALEDPAQVYARKSGAKGNGNGGRGERDTQEERVTSTSHPAVSQPASPLVSEEPSCPKCGGRMWSNVVENDERAASGQKLRPDHKCRSRSCDGVIWRKDGKKLPRVEASVPDDEYPHALRDSGDELPF